MHGDAASMRLSTLKRSAEFHRLRGGARWANTSFVIETKPRAASATTVAGPRFGFTVTKKLGGAVHRNRIRRRLKEAIRALDPGLASPGNDYVVVARSAVQEQPFAELKGLLETALAKLRQRPAAPPASGRPPTSASAQDQTSQDQRAAPKRRR